MKKRDTVILSARIKKTLFQALNERVAKLSKKSRNAWIIWAIEIGLRKHR